MRYASQIAAAPALALAFTLAGCASPAPSGPILYRVGGEPVASWTTTEDTTAVVSASPEIPEARVREWHAANRPAPGYVPDRTVYVETEREVHYVERPSYSYSSGWWWPALSLGWWGRHGWHGGWRLGWNAGWRGGCW